MQAQCWICPFCHDDHARNQECDINDLKKEIASLKEINSKLVEVTLVEWEMKCEKLEAQVKSAREIIEHVTYCADNPCPVIATSKDWLENNRGGE